ATPQRGQPFFFWIEFRGSVSAPPPSGGVFSLSTPSPSPVTAPPSRKNKPNFFLTTPPPPVNEAAPPTISPMFFPQIADSGGYTTQFILFSAQPGSSSSGTMQLFDQSGGALGLTLQ